MINRFALLKEALTFQLVLALIDLNKLFVVDTDTSNIAIGASISLNEEDASTPSVYFASWILNTSE